MPSRAPTRDDILKLESPYWDAMKAKDGEEAAALSGNTSLVTGSHGVMSIPRAKMSEMTQNEDWELLSYTFENVEFTTPISDVAIIAYVVRQKVKMNGEEKEFRAADSSTWVRNGDGWACHAHSETKLKE